MTDIGFALEAKSDQLNAVDIMGYEPVIRIRDVRVVNGDQPVSIYFDGDNNRPWKPSKGMLRILAGAWGRDSSQWVGRFAQIFFEPSVKYAGKEVGGIRIRALSDIDSRGLMFALTISKQKRDPYHVKMLDVPSTDYPADKFETAFPAMAKAMEAGKMTLQQVIAQCQKTGNLTSEQLGRLEAVAPQEVDQEDDQHIQ